VDKRRGITYIEALAATLILVIGIGGMFGIWRMSMNSIQNSNEVNIAGELARTDIEEAKIQGYKNLPQGTYTGTVIYPPDTAATGYGTWTGTTEFYDAMGAQQAIASANTATRFSLQRTIVSYRVLPVQSSTAFSLTDNSVRVIKVVVNEYPANTPLVTMGHVLVKGGL
jgi:Tfp pilus assembly protein PilV